MTVTDTNGQQATPEGWAPEVKADPTTVVAERGKRAHRAPVRAQAKAKWDAWPTWRRRGIAIPTVILVIFVGWSFIVGPIIDRAASKAVARAVPDIEAQFAGQLDAERASLESVLIDALDQRATALQNGLPPVVVTSDPLSWLVCGVGLDAQGLIGRAPPPAPATALNPERAAEVDRGARALAARGVPVPQMRVTLTPSGGVMVTGDVGSPLMAACPASGTAVAPAPTPTTAPAVTPVTPPPNAN